MPDRETVIDKINDIADYLLTKSYSDLLARDFYETVGRAIDLLKEQPEIVRCKDCKYLKWTDADDEVCFCRLQNMGHHWDFFCADGERR